MVGTGEMLKWLRRIAGAIVVMALAVMMLGPWALYWLALGKVVGRPAHALQATFAAEEAEALGRKLGEPLPIKVEPLSPYSYPWAIFTGHRLPRGSRLAEMVAMSHNA